jgi:thioredoxin 1
MNKKVLWISVGSALLLGVSGFFFWRHLKKKKENQLLLENSEELNEATEGEDTTKQASGEQTPPPHVDIQENVVYLSAKWCPACKENQETADAVYAKYKDKVEFRKLDAEDPLATSYGYQLELRQIPVLAFINEGKVIESMVGVKTMEEYDAMFEKFFPSLKEEEKPKPIKQPESKQATIEKKVKKIPKKIEEKIEKKEVEVVDKPMEAIIDGNGDLLGYTEVGSDADKGEKDDKE